MEIIKLDINDQRWQEFLSRDDHLVFHIPQYKKFIEEAFGTTYTVLAAVDNDEIKAILPLVEIKSKLLGNKIISSAYIEYGGFAGDEASISHILHFLDQQHKHNHDYLEIRGGLDSFNAILSSKLIKRNWYKRFILPLENEKETWNKIQHSKRKAINRGLESLQVKEVPLVDLKIFYELYCRNMKSFGSPPYSQNYFKSFYDTIINNHIGKIFGSYHQGKLVSALIGFCYRDRVHILIAVSDPTYNEYRPNDAMHWSFIKWACNNNYKWFDFGRVREDSGQFEYKQKWGPTLMDLPSYFLLWKAKEVPEVDPKKHELLVKVWKKLPLRATKLLGMRIRKGLGI